MRLKIKSVERIKTGTGKEYVKVRDEQNNEFSVWDTKLWEALKEGNELEVRVQEKGNFKNIVGIEKGQQRMANFPEKIVVKLEKENSEEYWKQRNIEIVRQSSLKVAGEWLIAHPGENGKRWTSNDVILLAEKFTGYVLKGLSGTLKPKEENGKQAKVGNK